MAHQTTDPTNPERWVVVYPAYIDSEKTIAQGRRIPKEKAVDKPDIRDIIRAVSSDDFQLPAKVENKAYCRDYLTRGRLRAQLKNADGSLVNPEFPDRKALYCYLADKIKHSEERKLQKEKEAREEAKAKAKAASKASKAAEPRHDKRQGRRGRKKR
ncbi:hypothetical protein PTSG_12433 [Salpingoeca rosetta]|uniref:Signal recognition particle 19 kDa protein n=1 Tax=Salpingoeca rosetta (strain ATCC 50818 / BSB-021) TaxID=946362 RepID=F2UCM1_SALR5|nr:uncharacterized protein PTSG_12433 [Salpingoeca rosetta]EGD74328.1 hypothetical protein PTSG_12433 [Salpingoeca rosetta]|eukprot:XP_004993228.1 hypothetical protein PTSG_12433 [Salpingoeca rosetta]